MHIIYVNYQTEGEAKAFLINFWQGRFKENVNPFLNIETGDWSLLSSL